MEDCVKELGKPYEEVHNWLDALWATLGVKHRSARHHMEGVQEIIKMYGEEAGKAAIIHIKRDYDGFIPKDRNEAQLWSLFGPNINSQGKTFLTDKEVTNEHNS